MARMLKVSIDKTAGTITWTAPGTTIPAQVLRLADVSEGNKLHGLYHGLVQRGSDNAADEKTAAGKMAAVGVIVAHLGSGATDWELPRATGPRPFDSGAVIAAMARVLFASDVDKANRMADAVAAKRSITREDALKMFAADERIASDMARAKAAAAPKVFDADAEVAALMAAQPEEPLDPTDAEMDPAADLRDEDPSTLS